MHTGPLLAHRQSRGNGHRQPNRLDKECREAQEALHDEPRNDAFHLRDARSSRIRREALDQPSSRKGEQRRPEKIEDIVCRPKTRPGLPLVAPALGAPAAKVLVEVKRRSAMSQLDITEPLGNDVQKRSVEPNGRSHKRNDNPGLTRIVGLCNLPPPLAPATL